MTSAPPPSESELHMTREALGNALQRLVDKAFHNAGKQDPRFSIPARPDDDDLSLLSALDELQHLRSALTASASRERRLQEALSAILGRYMACGKYYGGKLSRDATKDVKAARALLPASAETKEKSE